VAVLFYSLVILPPLLDSIIIPSFVEDYSVKGYFYPGKTTESESVWRCNDLFFDLITFYWFCPAPGKGILIVGITFMILASLYTYYKTKNLIKSGLAIASIWLMYYLFGAFTYFVPHLTFFSFRMDEELYYTIIYLISSIFIIHFIRISWQEHN
jgi:hypothetical protein